MVWNMEMMLVTFWQLWKCDVVFLCHIYSYQHSYCTFRLQHLLISELFIVPVDFCIYMLLQVTTHSRLLIGSDRKELAKLIRLKRDCIILHSLQAFNTEQQFCTMLKYGFTFCSWWLLCQVYCHSQLCESHSAQRYRQTDGRTDG